MNFCEGGDLYTKLKAQSKEGKILEETQVVEWFVQIAMALQVHCIQDVWHTYCMLVNIYKTVYTAVIC